MVEDILATLANPRVPTERDATARARAPGSEREKDLAGEDCAGPTAAAGGLRIPSRTPSGGPARRITPLPPPNGPNKAEAGLSFSVPAVRRQALARCTAFQHARCLTARCRKAQL